MADITHNDPVVTESKLTEFYNDIKPFLGCPAYLTSEGASDYYSTDEKVIGRWIDGKPLYQKSFSVGGLKNNDVTELNHSIANVDNIFIFNAFATNTTNGASIPLCYYDIRYPEYSVRAYVNKIKISLTTANNMTEYNKSYVTLRYTKTTDSASTTIQEDPNEYSTDEKIIGKWIDGKPIYQKTIETPFSNIAVGSTQWIRIANRADINLDELIDIKSKVVIGTDNIEEYIAPYYAIDSFSGVTDSNAAHMSLAASASGISMQIKQNIRNTSLSGKIVSTIQYTKTTD